MESKRYREEFSIYFVWHPNNENIVKPIVEKLSKDLQKDSKNPFSRSIHIPTFFVTTKSSDTTPNVITDTSKSSLIFIFCSCDTKSDSNWDNFYNKIVSNNPNSSFQRIILEEEANESIPSLNSQSYINFYKDNSNDLLYVRILRSIYTAITKERILKLFLSHTKKNKTTSKLVRDLDKFIHNLRGLDSFIDIFDIPEGNDILEQIDTNVPVSTLLVFKEELFSSRKWCQYEVLIAKEKQRPIISITCMTDDEDRSFPHLGNIPSIHISESLFNTNETYENLREDAFWKILNCALLESIRCEYVKELMHFNEDESNPIKLVRPPEPADLLRFCKDIKNTSYHVIYPDPPIFSSEIDLIEKFDIKTNSFMTSLDSYNYKGKNIGLSISNPTETELQKYHQSDSQLDQLTQELACNLLYRNASLVYGGDMRKNGFTEIVINAADFIRRRYRNNSELDNKSHKMVKNCLAWPIYNGSDAKKWISNNNNIAEIIKCPPPECISNFNININEQHLSSNNIQNYQLYTAKAMSLSIMRKNLIDESNARILIGGKLSEYSGFMPGILEELLYAINEKQPIFLLGGFGGLTSHICNFINNNTSDADKNNLFNFSWHLKNNEHLEGIIAVAKKHNPEYIPDYPEIQKKIKGMSFNNGLSDVENSRLFSTPYPNEAIQLIVKGCANCLQ